MINQFDSISPLDFRYCAAEEIKKKMQIYLSEEAAVKYMLRVEVALSKVLAEKGICKKECYEEINRACKNISAEEVYAEEKRMRHFIRALVNCIQNKVSDKAKPFVHLTATSHDIICTADALRFKEFTENILIPDLISFEKTLINIALREKDTLQIGRTHGQHAVPITFGFAIAEYVARTGECVERIRLDAQNIRGKMSGAVGSYNASSLVLNDPEAFERAVLSELGLTPATHSTQILPPEFVLGLVHDVIACYGVLANLSDDLRHLSRSEIDEIDEWFEESQVGSSTMPHKKNPIDFENVKSMWKAIMPRIMTLYLDQISEHQRDLSNSASSRFIPEIFAAVTESISRLHRRMNTLSVNKGQLKKNFEMNKTQIIAEPLYILLAYYGHPNAHEAVRMLSDEAERTGTPLVELASLSLDNYLKQFTPEQKNILKNPGEYTGIAASKTEKICNYWSERLG